MKGYEEGCPSYNHDPQKGQDAYQYPGGVGYFIWRHHSITWRIRSRRGGRISRHGLRIIRGLARLRVYGLYDLLWRAAYALSGDVSAEGVLAEITPFRLIGVVGSAARTLQEITP